MNSKSLLLLAPLSIGLIACDHNDDNSSLSNKSGVTPPSTYTFDSTLLQGESSVSYTGQTKRHLLINDLTAAITSMSDDASQDVIADLNFFYRFEGSSSDRVNYDFELTSQAVTPGPTYGDISAGKNLVGKTAGEDPGLINDAFFGWERGLDSTPTPTELVDYYFSEIKTLATDEATQKIGISAGENVDIDKAYISIHGQDYAQLVQKFLLGAVTYSQGVGDYLKTGFSGNNVDPDKAGAAYTTLQHKWDEAFGYFGAARNYTDFTDDEIAAKGGRAEFSQGYNDANGDGLVDIRSEINLGHSANCAKRDRGATDATDFTKQAFDAFTVGREILNGSQTLTSAALLELQTAALIVSHTWEKCIAATVVHYINGTLDDMGDFTTDNAYADLAAFKDHAKHWSEMKGFALGLQFNPDSPFRDSSESLNSLKQVFTLMGDAPVLADGTQSGATFVGGVSQYKADLLTARDIFKTTYDFTTGNVENW